MGVIYVESDTNDTDWTTQTEVDLGVTMSGTTDNGLSFGASFNISGDGGDGNTYTPGGTAPTNLGAGSSWTPATSATEDANVFVSGTFGTITFGEDIAEGNRRGGIADIGYDGLGVDDVVEDNQELTSANVGYSYTAGALTVGFSMKSDNAEAAPYAIGATYKAGALDINFGYANDDDTADTTSTTCLLYTSDAADE